MRSYCRIIRDLDSDDDSVEDAIDVICARAYRVAESNRYVGRHKYRKSSRRQQTFNDDLATDTNGEIGEIGGDTHRSWLSDPEFKQKYRMDRESFQKVLNKIEDHSVFQNIKGRKQCPVEQQLMVFLKFIGTEGDGASNSGQRNTFCIGYGTATTYQSRVVEALLSLRDEFISWPDADERLGIAKAFHEMADFPRCVGIVDGTLFPLAFAPQTKDAPDYSGRKFQYSLSVLIFNDHKRKIRHYLAGFPGSAHDNRIWNRTHLQRKPAEYFSEREYILGDSAFSNSSIMVSSYKKPLGATLPPDHEAFNNKLAKIRITSEHTIGMLKARFPWLRSIRMQIRESNSSLRKILRFIEATIILHNMLIDFTDATMKEWEDENDIVNHPGDVFGQTDGTVPFPTGQQPMRTYLLQHFKDCFLI